MLASLWLHAITKTDCGDVNGEFPAIVIEILGDIANYHIIRVYHNVHHSNNIINIDR